MVITRETNVHTVFRVASQTGGIALEIPSTPIKEMIGKSLPPGVVADMHDLKEQLAICSNQLTPLVVDRLGTPLPEHAGIIFMTIKELQVPMLNPKRVITLFSVCVVYEPDSDPTEPKV